jgi:methylated-DNA-[protein]-cysteine S-methyltransferase
MKSYAAVLSAPGFSIGIRCNDDEITEIAYLEPQVEVVAETLLAQDAVRQLRAWLQDPRFAFGLPLAPAGTHFQCRVWQQIAAIPAGQTRSYGEVAAAIHSGPRAVGNACGANPYPIVVPCHRVVAANHGLGGFARQRGGFLLDIKKWLLHHEHAKPSPRPLPAEGGDACSLRSGSTLALPWGGPAARHD